MRYLAIDYGSKRIGLAYGEDKTGVAVPIAPILDSVPWNTLERVIRARRIDAIVLGCPLEADGRMGSWARLVKVFGQRLTERFGLPVHLSDERLTTWDVERNLPGRRPKLAQLRKERRKGHTDSRAAALLLQDFLDEQQLVAGGNGESGGMGCFVREGQRWCGLCAYDGTDFVGWQSQLSGNTVQDVLERQLRKIFQQNTAVAGSGRTDAGVHAKGQVFHFDSPPWCHGTESLLRALGSGLPRPIRLLALIPAPTTFHARFSAIAKRYCYQLAFENSNPFQCRFRYFLGRRSYDGKMLQNAAPLFLGTHNFSSFANRRDNVDPHRTITRSEVFCDGTGWTYCVEGSGFLHRMVRRMAGALLDVACGKAMEQDILDRLCNSGQPSALATVPPQGLFLERVFYAKNSPIERWLQEQLGD